jgi:hypothetical protein
MDVLLKCMIVRTIGRSAYALEVPSRRNRAKTQDHTQHVGVARKT